MHYTAMDKDLTLGGEHTLQDTDGALENCTPGTYGILTDQSHPNKFNHKKELKVPLYRSFQ